MPLTVGITGLVTACGTQDHMFLANDALVAGVVDGGHQAVDFMGHGLIEVELAVTGYGIGGEDGDHAQGNDQFNQGETSAATNIHDADSKCPPLSVEWVFAAAHDFAQQGQIFLSR